MTLQNILEENEQVLFRHAPDIHPSRVDIVARILANSPEGSPTIRIEQSQDVPPGEIHVVNLKDEETVIGKISNVKYAFPDMVTAEFVITADYKPTHPITHLAGTYTV